MRFRIEKENNDIFILYSDGDQQIKYKFDYNAIDNIIDYIMEKDIEDITVDNNDECKQYVDLLSKIFAKIKTEDFKKIYNESISNNGKSC